MTLSHPMKLSLTIKLITTIDTTKMNWYFNQVPPFLNLKMRCAIKNKNRIIIGSNAGYK